LVFIYRPLSSSLLSWFVPFANSKSVFLFLTSTGQKLSPHCRLPPSVSDRGSKAVAAEADAPQRLSRLAGEVAVGGVAVYGCPAAGRAVGRGWGPEGLDRHVGCEFCGGFHAEAANSNTFTPSDYETEGRDSSLQVPI